MEKRNTTEELITTLETVAGAHTSSNTVVLGNGIVVAVSVCNTKTLPRLLRFVGKVAQELGLRLSDADGIATQLLQKVDDFGFLLQLVADYSDDVYELVVSLTDVPTKDALGEYSIDDLIVVLTRVVEINRDFFTVRVLPTLLKSLKVDQ